MYTTFSSTRWLADSSRTILTNLQKRLTTAQKEMTSGRHADVGLQLGSRAGRVVLLRQQVDELKVITETNSTATTRLDSMLATLKNITGSAQKFVSTLITVRNTTTGPGVGENEARANLNALIDNLNGGIGGEYLFAGINNGEQPVKTYYASGGSYARSAVAAAFTTAFGTTQDDAAGVEAITSTDMETFLDGAFADLFKPGASGWDLWSSAADDNIRSRISTTETVETSSSANIEAYRQLAEAYTMVADLGAANMNQGAYHAVIDKALQLVGNAVQGLAVEQSRLGTAQSRVESANNRMAMQIPVITDQINAMETVDPNEAATRVNTLLTQMNVAYSLTATIQKLSILNYL